MMLLLLAGFSRRAVDAPRPPRAAPEPTFAETDAPFPSDTASDVVSYADHVALVTAVAEAEVAQSASPAITTDGERAIARRVMFRIDETLWSRANAPPPPRRLTALWSGWLVRDGRRTPFVLHGTPWIIVGAQYVMPIAEEDATFAPIQPFAVFRLNDGAVMLEEQDTPLARQLTNAPRDRVAEVFTNAAPDPLSVQYGHLRPRARLAAVMAARPSVSTATPPDERAVVMPSLPST